LFNIYLFSFLRFLFKLIEFLRNKVVHFVISILNVSTILLLALMLASSFTNLLYE
jgi:TM2 domain-containing membrane protein YozV